MRGPRLRPDCVNHRRARAAAAAPPAAMGPDAPPVLRDLILIGGGHAHVEVLRRFGMAPEPGVRLTLVAGAGGGARAAYSGMLPGYVAGFYSRDECHVDLARLCAYANARLVRADATGIDLAARELLLGGGRPPLSYSALSINTGAAPAPAAVPGAVEHSTPVKPIGAFADRVDALLARARASQAPLRVAVVGGGAGGAELAAALAFRLRAERAPGAEPHRVALVSRGPILAALAPAARAAFLPLLAAQGVEVVEAAGGVAAARAGALKLARGGAPLAFDECLWCTAAGPPAWLAATGLPLGGGGFLAVNEFLQSDGGPPEVFAAGDAAHLARAPRPKAGVFAVRAGPPLAENLRRFLVGAPLRPWVPQRGALALLSGGGRAAVAARGRWAAGGAWAWRWKDRIDRRWMARYGEELDFEKRDRMMARAARRGGGAGALALRAFGAEGAALEAAAAARCGACGSKLGAGVVAGALARVRAGLAAADAADGVAPNASSALVLAGLEAPDDAAVLAPPPPGHVAVHTVDHLRCLQGWDPYLFGAAAATHALGDVFAMGAAPRAALAVATLPFAARGRLAADLHQLLAGAAAALRAAGCALVGGHSAEGGELALGVAVYGSAPPDALLRRGGLRPGQALVLSKALGTGLVLAAQMRGRARGPDLAAAADAMLLGAGPAAAALRAAGATGCVDVTGFGLLGHLAEMAEASGVAAEVDAGAAPLLPGAAAAAAAGVRSSLHAENARVAGVVTNAAATLAHALWPLLVDPQTCGGLLAGVPPERAGAAVAALRAAGYPDAAVVGRVLEAGAGGGAGRLTVLLPP